MQTFTRVTVVAHAGVGYARSVLRGVYVFAGPGKRWLLTQLQMEITAADLRTAAPDGVIAQVSTPQLADLMADLTVPVVNTSAVMGTCAFPRVGADDRLVGEQAARHLLERGLHTLAFIGVDYQHFSIQREAGFRATLERYQCQYHPRIVGHAENLMCDRHRLVGAWIAALPKPVGIFTHNDEWGLLACTQCLEQGFRVPEDVAIVGADNDDLACMNAYPHLSSVRIPAREIGYRAAELLDALIHGAPPPAEPLLLPPAGVEARASSDVLALADPETVAALRFIRRHACESIDVAAVLGAVPICRSALERRFRRYLGRSLQEEIQRVRLERARELLTSTSLPIAVIGAASGFSSAGYFARVFAHEVGMTPSAYRGRHGERTASPPTQTMRP